MPADAIAEPDGTEWDLQARSGRAHVRLEPRRHHHAAAVDEGPAALDVPRLAVLDDLWRRLAETSPTDVDVLLEANRFRLRHARVLPATRPRVILGGTVGAVFPNFHSLPLPRVADVVSITNQERDPAEIERVRLRCCCRTAASITPCARSSATTSKTACTS